MPSRVRRPVRLRSLGAALLGVALVGCTVSAPVQPGADTEDVGVAVTVEGGVLAAEVLAGLPVKGRAPQTGYDRELFGQTWADVDRNGCDTRNDVLRRDVAGAVLKEGTQGCVVLSGTVEDPYSGLALAFQRGEDTSSAVQIDHVVALSDAWQTGAQQLTVQERTAFANDPLNLVAVDGPLNQQKSDSDAASWLPPNSGYRCTYVARQVGVKNNYELWVTAAERDAITAVLQGCPGQTVPAETEVATPATGSTGPAAGGGAVAEPAAPAETATPDRGEVVVYRNCAEARAAGAAPIYSGQPGFSPELDGNDDGVACTS